MQTVNISNKIKIDNKYNQSNNFKSIIIFNEKDLKSKSFQTKLCGIQTDLIFVPRELTDDERKSMIISLSSIGKIINYNK